MFTLVFSSSKGSDDSDVTLRTPASLPYAITPGPKPGAAVPYVLNEESSIRTNAV